MTTSFRLFRAPLSEAGNAVEGVDCSLCGASSVVGFALGIGAEVLVACAACGLVAALDADERAGAPCARCGTTVDFPAGLLRPYADGGRDLDARALREEGGEAWITVGGPAVDAAETVLELRPPEAGERRAWSAWCAAPGTVDARAAADAAVLYAALTAFTGAAASERLPLSGELIGHRPRDRSTSAFASLLACDDEFPF